MDDSDHQLEEGGTLLWPHVIVRGPTQVTGLALDALPAVGQHNCSQGRGKLETGRVRRAATVRTRNHLLSFPRFLVNGTELSFFDYGSSEMDKPSIISRDMLRSDNKKFHLSASQHCF